MIRLQGHGIINKRSEKKNRENSYYKVQNLKDENKKLHTANYP
jgi:hypothetical protein